MTRTPNKFDDLFAPIAFGVLFALVNLDAFWPASHGWVRLIAPIAAGIIGGSAGWAILAYGESRYHGGRAEVYAEWGDWIAQLRRHVDNQEDT